MIVKINIAAQKQNRNKLIQALLEQINNNNNKNDSNKYINNKTAIIETIKQLLSNEFNDSDNEIKSGISSNNNNNK